MLYWGVVARRAWKETRAEIRLDSRVRIAIYIGVPVVAFAVVWKTTERPAWSVAGAGFVLVVGAICFLWKLVSIPPKMAAEEAEKLRAMSPLATAPMPDLTIGELFFHLDPNVADDEPNTHQNRRMVVGGVVMDALSLGKLQSWGRQIGAKSKRLPMTEIESGYWKYARWTYFFFDPSTAQNHHAQAEEDPPVYWREYADIQVNKAQVLRLWPTVLDD